MARTKKGASRPRRGQQRGAGKGAQEWVGGRLTLPVYIEEPVPFRPEMILWLELPEDLIVAQKLVAPNEAPVPFAQTLRQAMKAPLVGPPRRPRRIRVADAHLARELRGAVPDIEVVVAPTPELGELVARMLKSMAGDARSAGSYFESGRVGAQTIAALFEAAETLYRQAPWKLAEDSQVMRMDIPALGVEGACVSVIGALGESIGVLVFPSRLALDRYLECVDSVEALDQPFDMGTTILSLNFERGADLPPGMRREAVEHGWPIAGPAAYPWVQHRDRDGTVRPLGERDVRIATACASAVAAFFAEHRAAFEQSPAEPISERFFAPGGIEVRLVLPYEAGAASGASPEPSSKPAAVASVRTERDAAELHGVDGRLIEEMLTFAASRFGATWSGAARGLPEQADVVPLLGPFLVYHILIKGKPIAHWFAQANDRRLSDTERAWLRAQQAAWLSVWEVRNVEPGRSLSLTDLLTGEVRRVREVSASKMLSVRQAILGRVVDFEGMSLLCGIYARPLLPRQAAWVVERAQAPLRRKGAAPEERLREEKMGRYLIARWEEAIAELEAHPMPLPRLQNTDGEDLLLTVDRFELDPAQQGEIEAALAGIVGVEPPPSGEPDGCYVFARPGNAINADWESTVLGRAWLGDGKLRVEANSVARADRIRAQIETACGGRIRHRSRDHSDPRALLDRHEAPSTPPAAGSALAPEIESAAILEFKQRHYGSWPDQPLPALGGKTPRAAVRTKAGRQKVDLLLKELEGFEARAPEGQRFDFAALRRELGVAD